MYDDVLNCFYLRLKDSPVVSLNVPVTRHPRLSILGVWAGWPAPVSRRSPGRCQSVLCVQARDISHKV